MKTEMREKLKRLCDPGSKCEEEKQTHVITDINKGRLRLAMRAPLLVALPEPFGPEKDARKFMEMIHLAYFSSDDDRDWNWRVSSIEINLDDLRSWAGEPVYDRACECGGNKVCVECLGTGSVPCECSCCGNEHEANCTACNGKGHSCERCRGDGVIAFPERLGLIGGMVINRNALAMGLEFLEGDNATIFVRYSQMGRNDVFDRNSLRIENESGAVVIVEKRDAQEIPNEDCLEALISAGQATPKS